MKILEIIKLIKIIFKMYLIRQQEEKNVLPFNGKATVDTNIENTKWCKFFIESSLLGQITCLKLEVQKHENLKVNV